MEAPFSPWVYNYRVSILTEYRNQNSIKFRHGEGSQLLLTAHTLLTMKGLCLRHVFKIVILSKNINLWKQIEIIRYIYGKIHQSVCLSIPMYHLSVSLSIYLCSFKLFHHLNHDSQLLY